ncbi:condensation domain-containing protein [Streptomyces sp. NPDC093510]|uniref:condensation domain-containing protein n=1 Tax=Streptomyces sp. NPDC093510 TaxID=3155199 RepID=UPI00344593E8
MSGTAGTVADANANADVVPNVDADMGANANADADVSADVSAGQALTSTADAVPPATRRPGTRKETDLWLLEGLVPGSGVNNLSLTLDVEGPVDREALAHAIRLVVRRHEILRTVFHSSDTDLTSSVLDPAHTVVDVVEATVGEADAQRAVEEFVGVPFALDGGLLVRGAVFRIDGADRDIVCVALHHLIFDAMSTPSLLAELIGAYEAPDRYDTTPVPPAVEPEPSAESVRFWRDQLRGFHAPDSLWIGSPPSPEPDLAGGTSWHRLSADARAVVRRLEKELRAPEAVILLAAYCLLLSRHGAGADIVAGSPVSVRPAGREGAIGYHVNVLPLRVHVDAAKPFKRLVNRARGVFLEGLGNSGVPAESVLDEVREPASTWRNSLTNHLFNYVPGGMSAEFAFGGHPAGLRRVENGYSKFDLEFFFLAEEIRAVFRTQAFSATEVDLLLARYDALLVELGEHLDRPVGELSVWCAADRAAVGAGDRHEFGAGVRAFVAAPDGAELPVLVRGELCLEHTAEGRTVRTGDLVRWLPDGRIELLGRVAGREEGRQEKAAGVQEAVAQKAAAGGDVEALTARLLPLWREFLKGEEVTADSGFFASGGNSLLALQLLKRVKKDIGAERKARLADLFAHPTPRRLAHFLSGEAR